MSLIKKKKKAYTFVHSDLCSGTLHFFQFIMLGNIFQNCTLRWSTPSTTSNLPIQKAADGGAVHTATKLWLSLFCYSNILEPCQKYEPNLLVDFHSYHFSDIQNWNVSSSVK